MASFIYQFTLCSVRDRISIEKTYQYGKSRRDEIEKCKLLLALYEGCLMIFTKITNFVMAVFEKILFGFFRPYLKHFYKKRLRYPSKYLYERSYEYSFVLNNLVKYQCLSVLDVGTGNNSFASTMIHCGYNVTAIDKMEGYWKSFKNHHIYVINDDITKSELDDTFDAVICISTLEHIVNYEDAVSNMVKMLNHKGILILTFPYRYDKFCENVYALAESDQVAKNFRYIARSFSDGEIQKWCDLHKLEILEKEYILVKAIISDFDLLINS